MDKKVIAVIILTLVVIIFWIYIYMVYLKPKKVYPIPQPKPKKVYQKAMPPLSMDEVNQVKEVAQQQTIAETQYEEEEILPPVSTKNVSTLESKCIKMLKDFSINKGSNVIFKDGAGVWPPGEKGTWGTTTHADRGLFYKECETPKKGIVDNEPCTTSSECRNNKNGLNARCCGGRCIPERHHPRWCKYAGGREEETFRYY